MSATPPPIADDAVPRAGRLRLAPFHIWAAALAIGALVGVTIVLVQRHGSAAPAGTARPLIAAATWPAGVRVAPGFRLDDAAGRSFSLREFRGRPVLLTFIDPVCRDLCPLEAQTLMQAVRALPKEQRPAIVAVSVDPWADEKANFAVDATHWHLGPEWRWGIASHAALARVWAAYDIGWSATTKTIAGVTVHEISHTEGSYLIDKTGHVRALFLAPYGAVDVDKNVRALG